MKNYKGKKKPIYQLYDEFIYHERVCKICGYETYKNNEIEIHIREKHLGEIKT